MNNKGDEKSVTNKIALFNVTYHLNQNELCIEMILKTGKKNRNQVRKIISTIISASYKDVSKVRYKFRKQILGYVEGYEGTKQYHEHIKLQCALKAERIQNGHLKRKYTMHQKKYPYRPLSKKMNFVRRRYINIEDLHDNIRFNHNNQLLRYRLDIQFGYVLRNVATGEIKTFYRSTNSSYYNNYHIPLINDSVEEIIYNLDEHKLVEGIKRTSSSWSVDSIYEYVILTTPLEGMPIGSKINLPDFILKKRCIISFNSSEKNLCFWNCLAYHNCPGINKDRIYTPSVNLYKLYYKVNRIDSQYKGVDFEELSDIETFFQVNINIYRYQGDRALMERHSNKNFNKTLNLNIYTEQETKRNHFSFIIKVSTLTKTFQCSGCDAIIKYVKNMKAHTEIWKCKNNI